MADTVRFPDEVSASFTGELIGPGEAGYEQTRRVHNGLIDSGPRLSPGAAPSRIFKTRSS